MYIFVCKNVVKVFISDKVNKPKYNYIKRDGRHSCFINNKQTTKIEERKHHKQKKEDEKKTKKKKKSGGIYEKLIN